MATEKPYTILVRDTAGATSFEKAEALWAEHGPIDATSPEKAIEKLWELLPETKVNTSLLYFPVANFTPKKQRRRFIERWSLDDADLPDEDPPGQTELAT